MANLLAQLWNGGRTQPSERYIYVNKPLPASLNNNKGRPLQTFVSNKVTTSKYTLLTFIPKNLYEQFRRVANFFFLLIAVLQFFPEFVTIYPLVAALPMIIITSITAFKDGFEDFKRHVTDRTLNNRTTRTLGNWNNVNNDSSKTFFGYIKRCFGFDRTVSDGIEGAHWKDTLWKDVQVGDFLRLKEGDFIPAGQYFVIEMI